MASLNEAYCMLTPSTYNQHNAHIIQQISNEHRPQQTSQNPPTQSWWQSVWNNICNCFSYLFYCNWCASSGELLQESPHPTEPSTSVSPDPLSFATDNGLGKIPQDVAEARLAALIADRDRQDKEFCACSREDAQKKFDEFNRVKNEEIHTQFKQMQGERGY